MNASIRRANSTAARRTRSPTCPPYEDEEVTQGDPLLDQLSAAGWDLRALHAREKPTSAGIVLGEFAHKLAVKFKRVAPK